MNLSELLQGIDVKQITGAASREIAGLAYNSRGVRPGFLFFAVRGLAVDGNNFVSDALQRGAAAVVSERPPFLPAPAWVQVGNDRAAMAAVASSFYKHPSRQITLAGVTGTNGKTTTTFLLDAIFRDNGTKTAMLGTIQQRIGEDVRPMEHTTPEPPDTQLFLWRSVEAGCRFASMEVSSHALELRRCDATQFSASIFTNLTRDHLDFHGTMERYYAAKKRLFTDRTFGTPVCVINRDDPYGDRLWEEVTLPKTSFGLDRRNHFHPENLICGADGLSMKLAGRRNLSLWSPLIGRANAYNILGACAAALELGLPEEAVRGGIARLQCVPGRLERVPNDRGLDLFVDFAHSDDALKNVLLTARPIARGRLIVLFGCGGERDRAKRPLMGAVAARYADLAVLTSDNPRTEDPELILDEIEPALKASSTPYLRISDRKEAIRRALEAARSGDTVILAGKGHEEYQVIGRQKIPFSDREEALRALGTKR